MREVDETRLKRNARAIADAVNNTEVEDRAELFRKVAWELQLRCQNFTAVCFEAAADVYERKA